MSTKQSGRLFDPALYQRLLDLNDEQIVEALDLLDRVPKPIGGDAPRNRWERDRGRALELALGWIPYERGKDGLLNPEALRVIAVASQFEAYLRGESLPEAGG